MKIYKEYILLKDLPELPKDTILHWDLWQERYTELSYIGIDEKPKVSYKKEFLEAHTEWFKPLGKEKELYERFPNDFRKEHFYFGELRHNKMCRFCWDAQEILGSKEFEEEVTSLFKRLYDKKLKRLASQKPI